MWFSPLSSTSFGTSNGMYLAWLSDGTTSPSIRFIQSLTPYVLPNGTTIADNYTDLTDGALAAPIAIDESTSQRAQSTVWTGAGTDGTFAPPHCLGLMSNSNTDGRSGSNLSQNHGLTDAGSPCRPRPSALLLCPTSPAGAARRPRPACPRSPHAGEGGSSYLISFLLLSGIVVMRRRQAAY